MSEGLLGLRHVPAATLEAMLATADSMLEIVERPVKKLPTLRGRTVLLLFYEASTRTSASFAWACRYLGADALTFSPGASSVAKGESLQDTVQTLRSMGMQLLVVRHSRAGAAHYLAQALEIPVINAGDGRHEHPTQGLLDLFTIRRAKGRIEGLKVAILGDVLHSRVARSDIWGLRTLGAEVALAGPRTLVPPELAAAFDVTVCASVEEALAGADVVQVLRIQKERIQGGLLPRLEGYRERYGLNARRLALAAEDAIVMHPGPMNRGVEIESEVADGPQSVIRAMVTHGVAVRMALLYHVLGGGNRDA